MTKIFAQLAAEARAAGQAPPGYAFASLDYSTLEIVTHAQVIADLARRSR